LLQKIIIKKNLLINHTFEIQNTSNEFSSKSIKENAGIDKSEQVKTYCNFGKTGTQVKKIDFSETFCITNSFNFD